MEEQVYRNQEHERETGDLSCGFCESILEARRWLTMNGNEEVEKY